MKDVVSQGLEIAQLLNDNPALANEVGLNISAAATSKILKNVEPPVGAPTCYTDYSEGEFENTKNDMVRKLNGLNL